LTFLDAVASGQTVASGCRMVVVGGDNSAIDAARSALRMGCSATVIYRRERKDMPAIREDVDAAEQEGVRFIFLAAPHRIIGENATVKSIEVVKTRLGAFDSSGRRRPEETDEIQVIKCDSVVLAVGETVDRDFCAASGLTIKDSGMLEVDRYTLGTSRAKFYAGGDLVTGASAVSNAMSHGKEAARAIDQFLTGEGFYQSIFPNFAYDMKLPVVAGDSSRHVPRELPAKERAKTFQESVLGLGLEEALAESCRCLRCDIRESSGAVMHR